MTGNYVGDDGNGSMIETGSKSNNGSSGGGVVANASVLEPRLWHPENEGVNTTYSNTPMCSPCEGRGQRGSVPLISSSSSPSSSSSQPPLHAGSLRLFLGCLCRMLGDTPAGVASTMFDDDDSSMVTNVAASGPNSFQQEQGGSSGRAGFAKREAEQVLRALVEGELQCLGGVLNRRETGREGCERLDVFSRREERGEARPENMEVVMFF